MSAGKACGKDIEFIRTTNGKMMPVDPLPQITIITKEGVTVSGWTPHFNSCPGADGFRKKEENKNG